MVLRREMGALQKRNEGKGDIMNISLGKGGAVCFTREMRNHQILKGKRKI